MRRSSLDHGYRDVLSAALMGSRELNARTGEWVRSTPHQTLSCQHARSRLSVVGFRRVSLRVAGAELAWMVQGTTSAAWLQRHTKIWDKFLTDGELETAYGYRWREHFGRDQLQAAVDTLRDDPTSRQVVVLAWDPGRDGLGASGVKAANVPCPLGFVASLIGGQLHLDVPVRSSDVAVGLPYDHLVYSLLAAAMSHSLQADVGMVSLRLAHAHVYERDAELMGVLQRQGARDVTFPTPPFSLEDVYRRPDEYVAWLSANQPDVPGQPSVRLDAVA